MAGSITAIILDVVRILTFQRRQAAPPRRGEPAVNRSDTNRMR